MPDSETITSAPTLMGRLLELQRDLKVKKGQWNSHGNFKYRSREDILEAAKPLCHERGLVILCDDECLTMENGWQYARATAAIVDVATGERIEAHGWAHEPDLLKGMNASQITGTAASYAGKRALGNLFAIDDSDDADAEYPRPAEKQPPAQGPFSARCKACGHVHQFSDAANYEQWIAYWRQGGPQNRCCANMTLEVL